MGESKNAIIGVVVVIVAIVLIGVGIYFLTNKTQDNKIQDNKTSQESTSTINSSEKEEIVKKTFEKYFKDLNENAIEEINFKSVKIYTEEEIENDELLKDYNLKPEDIVFEINYELRMADGVSDMMQYTAGTGEIDGQWIREKYNCGIARYNSENDYTITDFGTGF